MPNNSILHRNPEEVPTHAESKAIGVPNIPRSGHSHCSRKGSANFGTCLGNPQGPRHLA